MGKGNPLPEMPRNRVVLRGKRKDTAYLCSVHGNPLVSVRAESAEGGSAFASMLGAFIAAPAMLDALRKAESTLASMQAEPCFTQHDAGTLAEVRAAIAEATTPHRG